MLRLISDLRFVPHADMPAKLDISTLSGNDLRMNQIKLPSAVSQDEIRVRAWAEVREALELQLAPLGQRALEALTARPGECVLDIGCGGGETALNLARAVAPNGSVLGIDLSGAMLGFARRAGNGCKRLRFVQGDAQVFPFEPASFDAAFSRFGVMFFADPTAFLRERASGIDADHQHFIVLIVRAEVLGDMLLVGGHGVKNSPQRMDRHVMVARYDQLGLRQAAQVFFGLGELPGFGALGEVAADDQQGWGMFAQFAHQFLGDGPVQFPEMQIGYVRDRPHDGGS